MTTETDTQSLVAEVKQLRADFSRIADVLHTIVRQRGSEVLGSAEDVAGKLFEEAQRRTNGLVHEIEQKPMTAALGTFSIGMLLGALFSARRA
jgi:ElaB/YqjD/DUF883 family membrane-anchored ribosome-binding protein